MIALRGLEPVCISWNDNAANSRANSPISSIDRTLRNDRGFVCAMADGSAEVEQTQSLRCTWDSPSIDNSDRSLDHKDNEWFVRVCTQCGVDSTYIGRSDLIFALREFDVTTGNGSAQSYRLDRC
jgi:hypothetical protein